jgi:maleylacetoacetate isomerase
MLYLSGYHTSQPRYPEGFLPSTAFFRKATMSTQPPFELFAFWRTSATFRVRVALNLKGLTAHERIVDVDAGEHLGEAFLKINPMGAIPALVEPGHAPLTQSLAILEFLEEFQPSPPLLPHGLQARARVRSLAAMLAADTHPLITPRIKKYLTGTGGFDDAAWRAWQIHWFGTGLAAFEKRLATDAETGVFCHGDAPTMADICLASVVAVMRVFKITVPGTPTIDRIIQTCDAHPAFAKAAPARQQGAPA